MAIMAVDVTKHKRAQETLKRQSRELALLHQAAQAIGSTLDLGQVLTTILEEVRHLLDVVACSVWLLDPDTGELVCRQATGPQKEIVRGWRLHPGVGLAGRVIRYGESFIVSDTQAEEQYFQGVDQETGLELRSILGAPLRVNGDVIGVVEAVDLDVDRFTLEDLLLIERLATAAGVAVENAQLYERVQQKIVECKRTEEKLREAHAELAAIYDNAPIAMLLVDRERRVRKANGTASQIADREIEEMIGLRGGDALRCLHALDDPQGCGFGSFCIDCPIRRAVLDTFETGRGHDGVEAKFPIFRAGKKMERWILISTKLLRVDGTERVLLCARDITERKQAEDERERYATEVERSNRDLQQFAHAVSHDLQAPLRTMRGYLDLLKQRCDDRIDDTERNYLGHVRGSAERMQEMIEALLDLSRIETRGRKFAPVDCESVLEHVLDDLGLEIKEANAEVSYGPLPTVMADEAQLAQVFQNLIANAIKFRKEDVPPHVHVSAEREGDEWVFSVADNGIGIDPEQADRLFQIFQRLHTREEYEGLGIGLALCRRVVERHGGRIWVESEPGEGSTFTFTIPVQAAGPESEHYRADI
jgi:signal transduction histidine kinase/putative methionine-R-sulfoxide reductase with GAF domain